MPIPSVLLQRAWDELWEAFGVEQRQKRMPCNGLLAAYQKRGVPPLSALFIVGEARQFAPRLRQLIAANTRMLFKFF